MVAASVQQLLLLYFAAGVLTGMCAMALHQKEKR